MHKLQSTGQIFQTVSVWKHSLLNASLYLIKHNKGGLLSRSGACQSMERELCLNMLWNPYPCSGRTIAFIKYSLTWFWSHAFPWPSQSCSAEPLCAQSFLCSGICPSFLGPSVSLLLLVALPLSHTCTLEKNQLKEAVQRHYRWFMSGSVHQKSSLEQKGSGPGRGQLSISSAVVAPRDTLKLVTAVKCIHAWTILCNRTGDSKIPNST